MILRLTLSESKWNGRLGSRRANFASITGLNTMKILLRRSWILIVIGYIRGQNAHSAPRRAFRGLAENIIAHFVILYSVASLDRDKIICYNRGRFWARSKVADFMQ